MKCDIIIAGVGGQGVLSIAAIIAESAGRSGFYVTQSEVHGMSQRGGAVVSHLRLSSQPIQSGTIGRGQADLIISLEPLESLRYLDFLDPRGEMIVNQVPVRNMPDYPDLESVLASIRRLPHATILDADQMAREAGSSRAANVVLVGAASRLLPLDATRIQEVIREWFSAKGEKVEKANLEAFARGQEAMQCQAA